MGEHRIVLRELVGSVREAFSNGCVCTQVRGIAVTHAGGYSCTGLCVCALPVFTCVLTSVRTYLYSFDLSGTCLKRWDLKASDISTFASFCGRVFVPSRPLWMINKSTKLAGLGVWAALDTLAASANLKSRLDPGLGRGERTWHPSVRCRLICAAHCDLFLAFSVREAALTWLVYY